MRIKLLDLNIWKGKLIDQAVEFINEESPDILALQEVLHNEKLPKEYNTYNTLRSKLNYKFADFAPALAWKEAVGNIVEGNAVFSRFPIVSSVATAINLPFDIIEHTEENFPQAPRVIQHVKLAFEDSELNLFNLQGIWDIHGNDNPARLQMAHKILETVGDNVPVVLVGDFNLNPDTQTVRLIETKFKSVFGNSLKTTFNMKQKTNPGFASSVVDMIFASSDVSIISRSCPDVDISDHLPLVTVLEI